jgi:chromosome segregation ATPase
MDLESIVKKIDSITDELSTLKKTLTISIQRLGTVDEKAENFLGLIREQKKEIERLNSVVNSLGHYDSAIAQMRVDFNRSLEEFEKRRSMNEKMGEKMRTEEIGALKLSIENHKQNIQQNLDKQNSQFSDQIEGFIKEIRTKAEKIESSQFSYDEINRKFEMVQQDISRNGKQMDNFHSELEVIKKRQEEIWTKLDVVMNDLKRGDSRFNEIIATESDRRQAQISFMEQQSVIQKQRENVWGQWQQQFDESIKEIYKLIPEMQNHLQDAKKIQGSFVEVNQKIERRTNELTEMYRLMSEKFRQEWDTYKTDLDQRWANISLVLEDKNKSYMSQLDQFKPRMQQVEDSTHEMQEVLYLMSSEIQKGMQGIMAMVNGWMDAFSSIKPNKER